MDYSKYISSDISLITIFHSIQYLLSGQPGQGYTVFFARQILMTFIGRHLVAYQGLYPTTKIVKIVILKHWFCRKLIKFPYSKTILRDKYVKSYFVMENYIRSNDIIYAEQVSWHLE